MGLPSLNPGMELLHTTPAWCAPFILSQGFKVTKQQNLGRRLGNGIYVTSRMETVALFNMGFLVKCQLTRPLKVLWLKEYDPKVINSLKREFGKQILTNSFHKAIPRNKQLKQKELIELVSYFVSKKDKRRDWWNWNNWTYFTRHIKRHGFDAVGQIDHNYEELLIHNPSSLKVISIHRFDATYEWVDNDIAMKKATIGDELTIRQLKALAWKEMREIYEGDDEIDKWGQDIINRLKSLNV